MKLVDTCVMFVSCWLLMSMAIDVLTPKELTVYMIAAAITPATAVSAILYSLRIPKLDLVFAVLWMISAMALVMIAPKPLSTLMAVAAAVRLLVAGAMINFQCWRSSKASVKSAEWREAA